MTSPGIENAWSALGVDAPGKQQFTSREAIPTV